MYIVLIKNFFVNAIGKLFCIHLGKKNQFLCFFRKRLSETHFSLWWIEEVENCFLNYVWWSKTPSSWSDDFIREHLGTKITRRNSSYPYGWDSFVNILGNQENIRLECSLRWLGNVQRRLPDVVVKMSSKIIVEGKREGWEYTKNDLDKNNVTWYN